MIAIHVSSQELDTVLAALRFYQEKGQCDPDARSIPIDAIATDSGEALDAEAIDALCERINTSESEPHPFEAFVKTVAGAFREEFDSEDDANGGDCVEVMHDLVDVARALLGQPSIAEAVEAHVALENPDEEDEGGEDGENYPLSADQQDVDTILAALWYYRQNGQGEPDNRSSEIHAIASGYGVSLDADGIDALRKRMAERSDGVELLREELDTVHAALVYYSLDGQDDPDIRDAVVHLIASASGPALDEAGLDDLIAVIEEVKDVADAKDSEKEWRCAA